MELLQHRSRRAWILHGQRCEALAASEFAMPGSCTDSGMKHLYHLSFRHAWILHGQRYETLVVSMFAVPGSCMDGGTKRWSHRNLPGLDLAWILQGLTRPRNAPWIGAVTDGCCMGSQCRTSVSAGAPAMTPCSKFQNHQISQFYILSQGKHFAEAQLCHHTLPCSRIACRARDLLASKRVLSTAAAPPATTAAAPPATPFDA